MPATLLPLAAHPATPGIAGLAVSASVQRVAAHECALLFRLEGPLADLSLPPPGACVPGERLWQHTCFEAFIALAGEVGYTEYNFSPSHAWARLVFADYRRPQAGPDDATAPNLRSVRDGDRLEFMARIRLGAPARACGTAGLEAGLATVVEDARGGLHYYALAHPARQPDFHRREAFRVALGPP